MKVGPNPEAYPMTVGRESRCALATPLPRLWPGASRAPPESRHRAGGKESVACGAKLQSLEAQQHENSLPATEIPI